MVALRTQCPMLLHCHRFSLTLFAPYAWTNPPNLYPETGLPSSPFRVLSATVPLAAQTYSRETSPLRTSRRFRAVPTGRRSFGKPVSTMGHRRQSSFGVTTAERSLPSVSKRTNSHTVHARHGSFYSSA